MLISGSINQTNEKKKKNSSSSWGIQKQQQQQTVSNIVNIKGMPKRDCEEWQEKKEHTQTNEKFKPWTFC